MPAQRNVRAPATRLARTVVRYEPTLQTLRGLLFHANNIRQTFVPVPTLSNPRGAHRFPCVEAILGSRALVHDCIVSMVDNQGGESSFLVSCQVGPSLSDNRGIQVLSPGSNWTGSVLVMKMGRRSRFIGLSAADREMAIAAAMRFIDACDGAELPYFVDSI